jgi:hypothetical protein
MIEVFLQRALHSVLLGIHPSNFLAMNAPTTMARIVEMMAKMAATN